MELRKSVKLKISEQKMSQKIRMSTEKEIPVMK